MADPDIQSILSGAASSADVLVTNLQASVTAATEMANILRSGGLENLGEQSEDVEENIRGARREAEKFNLKTLANTIRNLKTVAGAAKQAFEAILKTIRGLVQNTIAAVAEIEQGTRNSVTTIVSNLEILEEQGESVVSKIKEITPALKEVQKGLIAAAPKLVGVQAQDLLLTLNQVSIQFNNIIGQTNELESLGIADEFAAVEKLTINLTSAMKAVGLKTRDVNQEVRAILSGDIDINARLAKQLNITRNQIEAEKAKGTLVKFILDKTEAIAQANEVYNNSLENSVSVIKDVLNQFKKAVGFPAFEAAQDTLADIRNSLEGLAEGFNLIGNDIGQVFAEQIQKVGAVVITLIETVDKYKEQFGQLGKFIIREGGTAISFIIKVVIGLTEVLGSLIAGVELVNVAFNEFKSLLGEGASAIADKFTGKLQFIGDSLRGMGIIAEESGKKMRFGLDDAVKGAELASDALGEKGLLGNLGGGFKALLQVFPSVRQGIKDMNNSITNAAMNGQVMQDAYIDAALAIRNAVDEAKAAGDGDALDAQVEAFNKLQADVQANVDNIKEQLTEYGTALDAIGGNIDVNARAEVFEFDSKQIQLNIELAKTAAALTENVDKDKLKRLDVLKKRQNELVKIIKDENSTELQALEAKKELNSVNQEATDINNDLIDAYKKQNGELGIQGKNLKEIEDRGAHVGETLTAAMNSVSAATADANTKLKRFKELARAAGDALDFGADEDISEVFATAVEEIKKLEGKNFTSTLNELTGINDSLTKSLSTANKALKEQVKTQEASGQISAEQSDALQKELEVINQINAASEKSVDLALTRASIDQSAEPEAKQAADLVKLQEESSRLQSELLSARTEKQKELITNQLLSNAESQRSIQLELQRANSSNFIAGAKVREAEAAAATSQATARSAIVAKDIAVSTARWAEDSRQANEVTKKATTELERQIAVLEKREKQGKISEGEKEKLVLLHQELDLVNRINAAKFVQERLSLEVQSNMVTSEAERVALVQEEADKRKEIADLENQLAGNRQSQRINEANTAADELNKRMALLKLQKDVNANGIKLLKQSLQITKSIEDALDQAVIDAAEMEQKLNNIEISEIDFKLGNIDRVKEIFKAAEQSAGVLPGIVKQAAGELGGAFAQLAQDGRAGVMAEVELIKKKAQLEQQNRDAEQAAEQAKFDMQIRQLEMEEELLGLTEEKGALEALISKAQTEQLEIRIKLAKAEGTISQDDANALLALVDKQKQTADELINKSKQMAAEERKRKQAMIDNLKAQKAAAKAAGATKDQLAKWDDEINKATAAMGDFNGEAGNIPEFGGVGGLAAGARKNVGNFVTNWLTSEFSKEDQKIYFEGIQRLGKEAAGIMADVRRRVGSSIRVKTGSAGVDLASFFKKQRIQDTAAFGEIIRLQKKFIEDQEKERLAEQAAQEAARRAEQQADARRAFLKDLVREARQNRLEAAQQHLENLKQQKETAEAFKKQLIGTPETIFDKLTELFPDTESTNEELGKGFDALAEIFGKDVAEKLSQIIDIDQGIIEALEKGTVAPEDLVNQNKVFLDPNTGELILTGKDPDFEKLSQLIELQSIRQIEEQQLDALNGISASLMSNGQILAKFAGRVTDEGFILDKPGGSPLVDEQGRPLKFDFDAPIDQATQVLRDILATGDDANTDITAAVNDGTASVNDLKNLMLTTLDPESQFGKEAVVQFAEAQGGEQAAFDTRIGQNITPEQLDAAEAAVVVEEDRVEKADLDAVANDLGLKINNLAEDIKNGAILDLGQIAQLENAAETGSDAKVLNTLQQTSVPKEEKTVMGMTPVHGFGSIGLTPPGNGGSGLFKGGFVTPGVTSFRSQSIMGNSSSGGSVGGTTQNNYYPGGSAKNLDVTAGLGT